MQVITTGARAWSSRLRFGEVLAVALGLHVAGCGAHDRELDIEQHAGDLRASETAECGPLTDAGSEGEHDGGAAVIIREVRGINACRDIAPQIAADGRTFRATLNVNADAVGGILCHVLAVLEVPAGKEVAVGSVTVHGRADLGPGDHTLLTVIPGFVGQIEPEPRVAERLSGPRAGEFASKAMFAPPNQYYRKCPGGRCVLRLAIAMSSGSAFESDEGVSATSALIEVGPVEFLLRDVAAVSSADAGFGDLSTDPRGRP